MNIYRWWGVRTDEEQNSWSPCQWERGGIIRGIRWKDSVVEEIKRASVEWCCTIGYQVEKALFLVFYCWSDDSVVLEHILRLHLIQNKGLVTCWIDCLYPHHLVMIPCWCMSLSSGVEESNLKRGEKVKDLILIKNALFYLLYFFFFFFIITEGTTI